MDVIKFCGRLVHHKHHNFFFVVAGLFHFLLLKISNEILKASDFEREK